MWRRVIRPIKLLRDGVLDLIDRLPLSRSETGGPRRGPMSHLIILDGTMSSLTPGCETNAGLAYKLLHEANSAANLSIHYEAGLQWKDWKSGLDVMIGRGINRQIKRAYGVLASRYRPGDKIFLMGYSRGAYAVRSLAGVIERVGLLRAEEATERNIREVYRHYENPLITAANVAFAEAHCHRTVEIEAVAVWDTVKALGLRLPIFWRWADKRHGFHNHKLGPNVRHGFHALALNETRVAYEPVLWDCPGSYAGHMEQMWFRGTHGDVGGQLNGDVEARPLANIPLVWILEKIELCGVGLPVGWRSRFPQNALASSVGSWRGWGLLFWSRRRRVVGRDPSEIIHPTALEPDEPEVVSLGATHP